VEDGRREKRRGKKRKREKERKRERERKKEKGKRKKEIQANDPEIFLKNEFVEVELLWQHKVNKIFASRNCWIDRTAVMDEESLLQCIRSLYR